METSCIDMTRSTVVSEKKKTATYAPPLFLLLNIDYMQNGTGKDNEFYDISGASFDLNTIINIKSLCDWPSRGRLEYMYSAKRNPFP